MIMRSNSNGGDDGPSEFEESPDEEFPAGEGTADTQASVVCPYCSAAVEIALDPGSGAVQDYIEDCPVCCQPWDVRVEYRKDGSAEITLRATNE